MKDQNRILAAFTFIAFAAATIVSTCTAAETPAPLARPDDKPADQTKKVKVFILMGQSNMVGMGDIQPDTKPGTPTTLNKAEKKYPYLVDDAGQWTVRKDVYYYAARTKKGSPLSATSNNGNSIGPELAERYDHETDPDENVNLAGSSAQKAVVEKLSPQLRAQFR